MAAVGAPVDLGNAVAAAPAVAAPPAPAAPAAPAPPPAPTPFTDEIMNGVNGGVVGTSAGYELPYAVYIASLEPSLKHEYSDPGRRVPAPPAPAAAPGADPVTAELVRIKAYLNDADHADRRPPGMDSGKVNALVNKARDSPAVSALAKAALFDVTAYRDAVLAHLNTIAPGGFNFPGVGP